MCKIRRFDKDFFKRVVTLHSLKSYNLNFTGVRIIPGIYVGIFNTREAYPELLQYIKDIMRGE